jgi:hypothetical protein
VKHLKIAALLALGGVVGLAACGAEEAKKKKGTEDDGGSTGGAGGIDLTVGPGSGGGTTFCTEPTCVGSTPQGECDGGLPIDSGDAMDGARAMGLCKVADATSWGVLTAEWVRSDGQPLTGALLDGKGILNKFGPMQPREGNQMLVLSSGAARAPGDPGYQDPGGYAKEDFFAPPHGAPPGYPKESPSCPGVTTGPPYDSAGLRLKIRTPTDAKSFQFEFDFYTYEYPGWVCTEYNDFFVAMLSPVPSMLVDGNLSFDVQGNTISVNAGFLEACYPGTHGGKTFACSLGYSEIVGTGFDSGGGSAATSWLVTTAPVEVPGQEITLHFAIWDSGDQVLDSTVLIDNFRFELEEGQVGTVPVPE